MSNRIYEICGISFQLQAQAALIYGKQSILFEKSENSSDVFVNIKATPSIQNPSAHSLGRAAEKHIWRNGYTIYRMTHDRFRKDPHILVSYNLLNPSQTECFIQEASWPWVTRDAYIWSGIALNNLLLHFRTLILHASYIEHNRQGILFTAPSGTGKSTQAELWRKYRDATVLNGDKAGISLRETPMAHGVPFSGTSGICKNISLPLKAVVVLSQASENTIRLMAPSEAVAALSPNVFTDKLVPEEWSMALNLLLDLVAQVPVYSLACTPDERAVLALESAMNH